MQSNPTKKRYRQRDLKIDSCLTVVHWYWPRGGNSEFLPRILSVTLIAGRASLASPRSVSIMFLFPCKPGDLEKNRKFSKSLWSTKWKPMYYARREFYRSDQLSSSNNNYIYYSFTYKFNDKVKMNSNPIVSFFEKGARFLDSRLLLVDLNHKRDSLITFHLSAIHRN